MAVRHGDRIMVDPTPCWKNDTAVWDCLLTEAVIPTINRDQHYLRVERLYRKVFDTGREQLPGNCALGQLTSIGFKQDITAGEQFRTVYVESGFLSSNFTSKELYVRSDDVYRTMQSAQMFMTGMYPPSQPVEGRAGIMDINTMDPTFDDMSPNEKLCPKIAQYRDAFEKSPKFLAHYNNVTTKLFSDIKAALQVDNFGYKELFLLADCLNVHFCHRVEVPAAITSELYGRIMDEMTWVVYSFYSYPSPQEFSRVGIGFLIKEMFEEIDEMMEDKTSRRFLFYSGHDSTLMPLMTAFNVSNGKWTPYASYFIIELYEITGGSYAIRIMYNGEVQKLPFCEDKEICDMDTVKKYVETIVPKDRESECM